MLRSIGFRIGLLLLSLAALSVLGLMLTTARDQALTPGEKNLGVAALFMFWSLPVLFFGAGGVSFLVVSTTISCTGNSGVKAARHRVLSANA